MVIYKYKTQYLHLRIKNEHLFKVLYNLIYIILAYLLKCYYNFYVQHR